MDMAAWLGAPFEPILEPLRRADRQRFAQRAINPP
jgi:hypothetical protein